MMRIDRFFFVFWGLFFVGIWTGCDKPVRDPVYYGTLIENPKDPKELFDTLNIPAGKEKFDIPEIEGVDKKEILNMSY